MDKKMPEFLRKKTQKAKGEALELCIAAGAGHVTSAFSCAEIVATLYYSHLNIDPKNPQKKDRDRFIMSKNHGSVITFPILSDLGFFSDDDRNTYLQDGSPFGRHTKMPVPGVDFCGGSLGIGLGVGCGLAFGAKRKNEEWLTFVVLGDGECYEGCVWEAAGFAGAKKLSNLIVFLDRNQLALTDFTEKMLPLEPLTDKWEAFNWEARIIDGHSIEEINGALHDARCRNTGKPLIIIANTTKGRGVEFMENVPLWHGQAPKGEAAERARRQLKGGVK